MSLIVIYKYTFIIQSHFILQSMFSWTLMLGCGVKPFPPVVTGKRPADTAQAL
jgi:hypothetical protein